MNKFFAYITSIISAFITMAVVANTIGDGGILMFGIGIICGVLVGNKVFHLITGEKPKEIHFPKK